MNLLHIWLYIYVVKSLCMLSKICYWSCKLFSSARFVASSTKQLPPILRVFCWREACLNVRSLSQLRFQMERPKINKESLCRIGGFTSIRVQRDSVETLELITSNMKILVVYTTPSIFKECKCRHVLTLFVGTKINIFPPNSALLSRSVSEVERNLRFLKKMGKLIETEYIEDSPSRNAGNVRGAPISPWWLWRGPGWLKLCL